jgi:hypothetical protein
VVLGAAVVAPMQQHQGSGGGSPYGAAPAASSAMPLSSRPPSAQPQQQMGPSHEGLAAVSVAGVDRGFPDDEMLGGGAGASGANRWPREETLALIRIRSEMDATFRDATLKGPLWEDVSRYSNSSRIFLQPGP